MKKIIEKKLEQTKLRKIHKMNKLWYTITEIVKFLNVKWYNT